MVMFGEVLFIVPYMHLFLEFYTLYKSLFNSPGAHMSIVRALSQKRYPNSSETWAKFSAECLTTCRADAGPPVKLIRVTSG